MANKGVGRLPVVARERPRRIVGMLTRSDLLKARERYLELEHRRERLLRLPWQDALRRPGGTVSGPALMGLADMAMWCALLGRTGGRDESLTTSLSVNFLRRLAPGAVLAEARVLKPGARLLFGEVLLRGEGQEEPAAHVTTTWAAAPPPAGR